MKQNNLSAQPQPSKMPLKKISSPFLEFCMSPFKILAVAALSMVTMPLVACSEDAPPLSPAAKQQMEQVIRDYLITNPEVVIEALTAFQQQENEAAAARQRDAMGALENDLKNNPNDPVLGNPDGDVTVVEFFDYRCGFCKRAHADVKTIMNNDGKVRFVLKEFPILGADSERAARASQAVWLHQQDKYAAFHTAMMGNKGDLGADKVLELAQTAGVDTTALMEQMKDPKIDETFSATAAQAGALNITGTPAFVFGNNVQPGAIGLEMMQELIAAMRKQP